MLIAAVVSAIEIPEAQHLETYIMAIEWEVIFFLIAMFTIVEILIEAKVFHVVAKHIVNRYKNNIRKMFYVICIVSTLLASILEDLSVAIIFIPIIVLTCREIEINPSPFLLGMTICINLASTLTPFGSAENIMIANYFDLSFKDFLINFGPFFIVSTTITLILLDYFVLSKEIKKKWRAKCESDNDSYSEEQGKEMLSAIQVDKMTLIKNSVSFVIFILLLIFIDEIHVAGLIGLLLFVFVNPKTDESKKKKPQLSYFLHKVDYKLIYFFMCLFILVGLMELNGTVGLLEELILNLSLNNIFLLSVFILIITSLLSGFLDNAPVTIIFLPIIKILIDTGLFDSIPLLIAFVLGVNLGGNFLPQGSAADMMTLELSKKYCVEDLTYKKLTKVGGTFALIHIILGIIYLAIFIYLIL